MLEALEDRVQRVFRENPAEDKGMAAAVMRDNFSKTCISNSDGAAPGPSSSEPSRDFFGPIVDSCASNLKNLATEMANLGLGKATVLPASPGPSTVEATVNPASSGPAAGEVTALPASPSPLALEATTATGTPPRTPPATVLPPQPPRLHSTPTRFYSRRRLRQARHQEETLVEDGEVPAMATCRPTPAPPVDQPDMTGVGRDAAGAS